MQRSFSYLHAKRSSAVLLAVFGERTFIGIFWAAGLLLSMSWFGDFVYSLSIDDWSYYRAFLALTFPVVFGSLIWRARTISAHVIVRVEQKRPEKHPVLVVFLSPPGKEDESKLEDPSTFGEFIKESSGRISIQGVREWFKGPWRMPLEAIAYHLDELRKIIVVYSSDAPGKQDGTYRSYSRFRDLLTTLLGWRRDGGKQIIGLGEIDQRWLEGVDFEDADALVNGALTKVFEWLYEQKVSDETIIVDITGGQKIPAVAGSVFTLGEGRKLQYVSTRDYKVLSYDITYTAGS